MTRRIVWVIALVVLALVIIWQVDYGSFSNCNCKWHGRFMIKAYENTLTDCSMLCLVEPTPPPLPWYARLVNAI